MPLKLNVGLSRKVGDNNYGSHGASVHVELEVESALANDPGKLQDRIRQVFNLVRASLTEELNGHGHGHADAPPASNNGNGQRQAPAANGSRNGNGQSNGQRHAPASNGSNKGRLATVSQIRAIRAIANRVGTNLSQLLRERFNVSRPDDLSIGDASTLIDELKAEQGSEN